MQLELFKEELAKEKLSTNLTTNRYPIHRWFNFIAGFSPEFVSWCIQQEQRRGETILIDPFAGLSTALVQANLQGIASVGFEAHPFFYDISQAKLSPPADRRHIDEIEAVARDAVQTFSGDLREIWSEDAVTYLLKLIPEPDLRCLASALLIEDTISPISRPLYRLVMSSVLEHTAHSQTDGIYKAPTTQKKSTRYNAALAKVCNEIRDDVDAIGSTLRYLSNLYAGSSENMSQIADESCSLCVTSPPYLNNFDFAEMTRMELYYWRYASSWVTIQEGRQGPTLVE